MVQEPLLSAVSGCFYYWEFAKKTFLFAIEKAFSQRQNRFVFDKKRSRAKNPMPNA